MHNAMNVSGNLCDVTSGISAGTAGVAGAPVLHLLQPPTAGIFLSGYYPLPHSTPTATQPM
ncbi:unnamed protein product [Protopolystoma xenopodis]|uniref:Uncharacterized protein n=1 Tax=Protopolystoma xenopodis TaxID=117903 RepID=A0A3S5FDD4_9PLAT|nr:unnamed protein product [Protopolystoma xenopodis]